MTAAPSGGSRGVQVQTNETPEQCKGCRAIRHHEVDRCYLRNVKGFSSVCYEVNRGNNCIHFEAMTLADMVQEATRNT